MGLVRKHRTRVLGWLTLTLGVAGLLASCSGMSGLELDLRNLFSDIQPSATPAPVSTLPPSPPGSAAAATAQPSPSPEPETLVVWVPPELNPAGEGQAAAALQARLDAFTQETGARVEVRVKAAQGPGGMLDALSAASAAAPDAVPALVALPRSDLENAALKGLVFSLDGLTTILEDVDWYPYALQLARIQETTFGLPFGGDALLLLYRPARVGPAPANWEEVFRLGQPVSFPAADPHSLLTLNLYLASGGEVVDDQRRPAVDAGQLAAVLQLYSEGGKAGAFPYWLSQIQSDEQAWAAYTDQRAQWLVTWASQYLLELPADTTAAAMLSPGEQSFSLATGWVWAVADPQADHRAVSVKLAEFLVEPRFLAEWTRAAGMLPTRPSSLGFWPDQTLRAMISPVVLSAQLRPANDLMSSLGPALEAATLQVIKREMDPAQAAQTAFERLSLQKAK